MQKRWFWRPPCPWSSIGLEPWLHEPTTCWWKLRESDPCSRCPEPLNVQFPRKLLGYQTTHLHISSPTAGHEEKHSLIHSHGPARKQVARSKEITFNCCSEVPSQGAYKYVGSDQAAQENHRNKRGIGHDSVTGRSPKKVSGSITAEEVMNIAMETGPRRTGLMINSCSVIEPFCFLRRLQVQTSTTSALSRLDPKEWASNRTFSAAQPSLRWLEFSVSSLFHEYKSCPRTPDLEAARTASPQKWPESQSTVTNARGQRRWIRSGTRQGDRQSQRETSSEQPPGCPRSQLRPRCKTNQSHDLPPATPMPRMAPKVEIFSLLSLLKYRSPSSPTRKGLSAPLKARYAGVTLKTSGLMTSIFESFSATFECNACLWSSVWSIICLWLCTVTRVTGAADPADQSRRLIYSAMRVRTQTKIVRHRKIRRIRIWKWNVGNVAFILSWPSKSHPAWSDHLCLSHSCCFRELTTGNFWSTWPCVSTSTHQDRLNIPCNM